jgi:hypothetical protein
MFDIAKRILRPNTWQGIAGGTIPGGSLVKISSDKAVVGTIQSQEIIGCSITGRTKVLNDSIEAIISGRGHVLAGEAIEAGKKLKALAGGYIGRLVDAALAGTLIVDDEAGGNFGNQPANDTVTVVSDDENDVGQTVTIYGIENTTGHLEVEVLELNGTTDVDGTIVWDRIHAVVLSAVCAGTIEVSETSGGLAITTILTTALSAGYKAVTDPRAFGIKPTVVAGGASSKYVQLIGTDNNGATQAEEIQLNGATPVTATLAYKTVDAILVGDVASASVVDLAIGAEEDEENIVGIALESASVMGDLIEYAIR